MPYIYIYIYIGKIGIFANSVDQDEMAHELHCLSLWSCFFNSPGLCPWRDYVVTQSLASKSVRVHVRDHVGIRVSTVFKFSKVCIVYFFNLII